MFLKPLVEPLFTKLLLLALWMHHMYPCENPLDTVSIFMPGRLCLFGEHSDWAGEYRTINPQIEKGYAIIVPTSQGLYAKIHPEEEKFIFTATLETGLRIGPFETEMDESTLKKQAEGGGFFSYISGVALQYLQKYHVKGLRIDNYRTDLPIKKGLSSSAAACELVSRAFNRTYHLQLSLREEMEMSYLGERSTPSRCGRMDHACGFGKNPILLEFDGNSLQVSPITLGKTLYFVIVDLQGKKDTKKILQSLQESYPFASTSFQYGIQKLFGKTNAEIISRAIEALRIGDAQTIGTLMKEAQTAFDTYAQPACPEELRSPLLHSLLNYPAIQSYIYGGKGVGSQGDGSAQLIVVDEESQKEVCRIIENELKMRCIPLVLG